MAQVVSTMRTLSVDSVKVVQVVAELYNEADLSFNEAPRYWSNVKAIRDLMLQELWRLESDPAPRNDELIEGVKKDIKLPIVRGKASVEVRG
jgi:hypothetical protein